MNDPDYVGLGPAGAFGAGEADAVFTGAGTAGASLAEVSFAEVVASAV
jgi:hypothetical protein